MREVRSWVNWLLAGLFALLHIDKLRDVLIKWATQKVHDELEERFNEDRVGEKFIQHGTFVFNRIILKAKDGHISKEEAQTILKYLRRFYMVWRQYKKKSGREGVDSVMQVIRELHDEIG